MSQLSQRFTLDGSDELEQHLWRTCLQVRTAVTEQISPTRLEALLLGGGYGRGEGGVLPTPQGEAPYNDLEFYVFVRGLPALAELRYGRLLHESGDRLSPAAGVTVEFKVLTVSDLRKSRPSMFYYDLACGHRRLAGEDVFRQCPQHLEGAEIPLAEATRLLMNRCSGLLFSDDLLNAGALDPSDSDFIYRNQAKAQLAFGDVLLTAHRQYHWSCLERHNRMKHLAAKETSWAKKLLPHHEAGLQFKLHPVRSNASHEVLYRRQNELVALARELWLWLESRRLEREFTSHRQYALCRERLITERQPLKNQLLNLRTFGLPGLWGRHSRRYPREHLLRSLALLLFHHDFDKDREAVAAVQDALHTNVTDRSGLIRAYRHVWGRFS